MGLSILYYLALIAISFGTVFIEFSYAKVVGTAINWFFFFPWPSNVVEINILVFAIGIVIAFVGCLLLWRWHSYVLSNNVEEYTKRWKVGYKILLMISVILCLLAEIAAYLIKVLDAIEKYGTFLLPISFLTVPVIMFILAIKSKRGR